MTTRGIVVRLLIMIPVDLFQFRLRILIDLSRFRLEFQLMDERMIACFINSRDKDKDILLFFYEKDTVPVYLIKMVQL